MSFADNLQYLRRKNKITQEGLAEELGVSRQSVSKWETGEAYPETEKLIAISEKFGITLDELLRGDIGGKSAAEQTDGQTAMDSEAPVAAGAELAAGGENCTEGKTCADGECKCGKHVSPSLLGSALSSATILACAVVYLCLGLTLDLWHPAWLVFLGGVIVCIWIGSFTDIHQRKKPLKERIGGAVCGSVMIAAVLIYLSIGFTAGIWHPSWVVFIVAVGVCAVVGALTNAGGNGE